MTRPHTHRNRGGPQRFRKDHLCLFALSETQGWGGIKYTKTDIYCSLIDERDMLLTEGKDTRECWTQALERVLWVKSPPSELGDLLPLAMEKLSDLKGVIVEVTAPLSFWCLIL